MRVEIESKHFIIVEDGAKRYRLSVACEKGVVFFQGILGKTWHANMGEIYDPDEGIIIEESPGACDNPETVLSRLSLDNPNIQRLLEELNGRSNNAVVSLHKG